MLIDLVGKRFERLVVLSRAENNRHGQPCWNCRCDCGTVKVVHGQSLRIGFSRSCGCLRTEDRRRRTAPGGPLDNRKHGLWKSAEYSVWRSMKDRCTPSSKDAPRYFDRGIYVCERWLKSFENFLADVGLRPSENHTLERVDNNGPYSPDNVVWASRKRQQRNRRTNRMVTIGDRTRCVADWADEFGISWACFHNRLRNGWPEHRLSEPNHQSGP